MRPTANRLSALRAPLDHILGTEVNVRLLRILTLTREPVSATRLAVEARLSAPGVYQALAGLREAGIVERIGRGTRGQVQLRTRHPLAHTLTTLFDAERLRFERLLASLQQAAARLAPPPRSVLLFGPVAESTDRFADPVRLALIAESAIVSTLVDTFRSALVRLQRHDDVAIEVRGLTDADLLALSDAERSALITALTVFGLPPDAVWPGTAATLRSRRSSRGPADHDDRLLRLARAISDKLKRDPSLVTEARRYIKARSRSASAGERKALREWAELLRGLSVPKLRAFLTDSGERATRLRQTMPFLNSLSATERNALLRRTSP